MGAGGYEWRNASLLAEQPSGGGPQQPGPGRRRPRSGAGALLERRPARPGAGRLCAAPARGITSHRSVQALAAPSLAQWRGGRGRMGGRGAGGARGHAHSTGRGYAMGKAGSANGAAARLGACVGPRGGLRKRVHSIEGIRRLRSVGWVGPFWAALRGVTDPSGVGALCSRRQRGSAGCCGRRRSRGAAGGRTRVRAR
ncbi:MAG: hypothetical protein J3K34DRAFT_438789 [Monoraphidium minutum]|nr:MAG: hypothetical protein J3K34DRAFT_438789 [Monoraphidium minutum]